jgi:acyl-CoA reductase-like NAD-dependent aldehyde dehydrogenase
MLTITPFGIPLPETPGGGTKACGLGREGGIEGRQVYMQAKLIGHVG